MKHIGKSGKPTTCRAASIETCTAVPPEGVTQVHGNTNVEVYAGMGQQFADQLVQESLKKEHDRRGGSLGIPLRTTVEAEADEGKQAKENFYNTAIRLGENTALLTHDDYDKVVWAADLDHSLEIALKTYSQTPNNGWTDVMGRATRSEKNIKRYRNVLTARVLENEKLRTAVIRVAEMQAQSLSFARAYHASEVSEPEKVTELFEKHWKEGGDGVLSHSDTLARASELQEQREKLMNGFVTPKQVLNGAGLVTDRSTALAFLNKEMMLCADALRSGGRSWTSNSDAVRKAL